MAGGRAVRRLAEREWNGTPLCGAPVRDFTPSPGTNQLPRSCQYVVAAAHEAMAAAELADKFGRAVQGLEAAVSIGTSKPSSPVPDGRSGNATPLRCLPGDPALAARSVASAVNATGPVHTTIAACATGTQAIGRGVRMIRDAEAEVVLAGSTDASIETLWLAAYARMGLLAPPHVEHGPSMACRPFDRDRRGFAVGEGAAVLVLESRNHARRRSFNHPFARISGYASGSDPSGLTDLDPEALPLSRVIRTALDDAGVKRPTCIFAHGTGTVANDAAEIAALRRILGRGLERVPVISLKGVMGHLMGGAGAVETALAVLACDRRATPGNRTLLVPDPELGHVRLPTEAFELPRGPILKTSLGFGGHLAALVIEPV